MNLSAQLHETAIALSSKQAYYFMDESSSYAELDGAVTKFASGLEKLGKKKAIILHCCLGTHRILLSAFTEQCV